MPKDVEMVPSGWVACFSEPWDQETGFDSWLLYWKEKSICLLNFRFRSTSPYWLSNNWPALYPLKDIWGCVGICLTNLHVLQTWRRHLAAFLEVSCRGVLQEYRVSGLLIWVICSPHNNKHKPQTCSRCKLNSDRTELLIHLINFCGQNFSV